MIRIGWRITPLRVIVLFVLRATAPASEQAQIKVSALYQERGAELLHFALALAHDEELAKDALQETFMRYFVALSEGKEIASPRAWLYRVMHNYLLDRMKELRRPIEPAASAERWSRHDREIEHNCLRHEIMRLVRASLSAGEYKCLVLRTEGLRYEEIAARLNVSSGTVGALLSRAVGKLRRTLVPAGGDSR